MRAIAILVIGALAAFAFASGAGARGAAETKVTIKGPDGDFSGKVKSPSAKCLGGREVTVFKIKGNGYDPAHDTLIASDTSERHGDRGVWSVGNTGEKKGAFYAYVPRSPGCKKSFSIALIL